MKKDLDALRSLDLQLVMNGVQQAAGNMHHIMPAMGNALMELGMALNTPTRSHYDRLIDGILSGTSAEANAVNYMRRLDQKESIDFSYKGPDADRNMAKFNTVPHARVLTDSQLESLNSIMKHANGWSDPNRRLCTFNETHFTTTMEMTHSVYRFDVVVTSHLSDVTFRRYWPEDLVKYTSEHLRAMLRYEEWLIQDVKQHSPHFSPLTEKDATKALTKELVNFIPHKCLDSGDVPMYFKLGKSGFSFKFNTGHWQSDRTQPFLLEKTARGSDSLLEIQACIALGMMDKVKEGLKRFSDLMEGLTGELKDISWLSEYNQWNGMQDLVLARLSNEGAGSVDHFNSIRSVKVDLGQGFKLEFPLSLDSSKGILAGTPELDDSWTGACVSGYADCLTMSKYQYGYGSRDHETNDDPARQLRLHVMQTILLGKYEMSKYFIKISAQ